MSNDGEIVLGSPPPQPVKKMRADARARAETVWNARIAGASWQRCAEIAGLATGQNAIRCVREAFGEVPQIDRDELRHLWRERTERLWSQALRDVLDQRQGAVVAAVKVAAHAAFLDGLGAPQRVDVGIVAVLADLDRLMHEEGL